jgi:hypothetical protein
MTTRRRNLLIAGAVIGIAAALVVRGLPPNEWASGRRTIDVTLNVADADNAQPIAGARVTVFDHAAIRDLVGRAALDGAEYDVDVFTTGADGSCRFQRVFPLYTKSLRESKDNLRRPVTLAKVAAPGHIPVLFKLDGFLPFPPKNSSDEKLLVVSIVLVSGDEHTPEAHPAVINGLRYEVDPKTRAP